MDKGAPFVFLISRSSFEKNVKDYGGEKMEERLLVVRMLEEDIDGRMDW
jgi:hypothetical protein